MAPSRKPIRPTAAKTTAKAKPREKLPAKPAPVSRPQVAVAKPAAKPTPPPPPAAPAKPVAPAVPPFDKEWLDSMRVVLLQRRTQINSVVQAGQSQLAANEGDPSDIADRASDGFEDELTAGLLSIEASQLDEVDAAIARMNSGVYGICVRCGKPIPRKRLEILPFAKRCLKCEGEKERSRSMFEPDEAGGDDDDDEPEAD